MIIVKNRKTYKGPGEWICRGRSPLGNPFKMEKESDRHCVIQKYRVWFIEEFYNPDDTTVRNEFHRLVKIALKGDLTLICWCAPKECHGDYLKEAIERYIEKLKGVIDG